MAQKYFNDVEIGVEVNIVGAVVQGIGGGGTWFDLLVK